MADRGPLARDHERAGGPRSQHDESSAPSTESASSISRRCWPARSAPCCWPTRAPRSSRSSRSTATTRASSGPTTPTTSCKAFGGYFASVNRNKKSIAIDLKQPEGRELVMRLCDGADAVVENYRGGVMDRLGLGYETLHERFPKLVYATIRGFGDWRTGRSPYTDWPAYDVVGPGVRRRHGDHRARQGHADEGRPRHRRPDARHHVRRRHRQRHPARPQDRPRPVRRCRHGRRHPVDVRAHRAPAFLHRRRAGAGGQPPSPALPVRHVPGQGRPRHHRRPRRHALSRSSAA